MDKQLADAIDRKLNGALSIMATQDTRTASLELLFLARSEAERRGLVKPESSALQAGGLLQSAREASNAATK